MSGEEDYTESGDVTGMLEALARAETLHHLSDTELNSYENFALEHLSFVSYLNEILEKTKKEKEYKANKKKEEERKKKEEEERQRNAAAAPVSSGLKTSLPIDTVIHMLTNQKQIDILERVKRRGLDDQMYFVNFERNSRQDTARYKALMGTFTIMGTLNKKGVRESYNVDLYNPDVYDSSKKIFNCDCPAHRFKSSGDNTVCKHISFIMCRIIGYVTTEFFTNHRLNKDEVNMIMHKMSAQRDVIMTHIEINRMRDASAAINDKMIIQKKMLTRDSYLNSSKPVNEEDCPICFDSIEMNENRLNCPDCKKHVHKECMEIWLSRNKSCVHCRSDNWKHYSVCFVNNQSIELLE
jgi:hypothetical protein